ncbi:MAG: hypothetical protein GTO41_28850 [Burkholderiales bacterium]|nr:hypothetical protein [Burkholderiales bacterium]
MLDEAILNSTLMLVLAREDSTMTLGLTAFVGPARTISKIAGNAMASATGRVMEALLLSGKSFYQGIYA